MSYIIVIILPGCSVGKSGNDKQYKIYNYNMEYFLCIMYFENVLFTLISATLWSKNITNTIGDHHTM